MRLQVGAYDEARPRDGELPFNDDLRDPSFDWTLAKPGRLVILQRGMGTGAYRKHADTSAVKCCGHGCGMLCFRLWSELVSLIDCVQPVSSWIGQHMQRG